VLHECVYVQCTVHACVCARVHVDVLCV